MARYFTPILSPKYLPPNWNYCKDWLKQIFSDTKKLMDTAALKQIKVPHYDELSVSAIFERYKTDAELQKYFPDKMAKGKQIDRTYFWNVFNTLYPEVVKEIIGHA